MIVAVAAAKTIINEDANTERVSNPIRASRLAETCFAQV
jgi:hypothetical protein